MGDFSWMLSGAAWNRKIGLKNAEPTWSSHSLKKISGNSPFLILPVYLVCCGSLTMGDNTL